MANTLNSEKDAIVFLGLLANASARFDVQFTHPDDTFTHTKGLNIFSCIVDNRDGEVLSFARNEIHGYYNPLLHAEQKALHSGIDRINTKNKVDKNLISVEKYYRKEMFYSADEKNPGCTLYTTLEPCPYCTSALLVSRMSRIVYILPDTVYGGSFELIKGKFYNKNSIIYEQLRFPDCESNGLIDSANSLYISLLQHVNRIKSENLNINETLLLDYIKKDLADIEQMFVNIKPESIISDDAQKLANQKTLSDLQNLLKL